jgi:type IV secretory pathway VirB10-like protein
MIPKQDVPQYDNEVSTPAQTNAPAASTPAGPMRGLFTSMYENKIIVIIIVVVILIIGIIAYVVLKKTDDEERPKNPRPPPAQQQPVKPAAVMDATQQSQLAPTTTAQTPQPTPEQPAPVQSTQPAPEPVKPKAKVDLTELYQRSKNATNKTQPVSEPAEEPEPNSKSDDELRHLMEDDGEAENTEEYEEQNEADDDTSHEDNEADQTTAVENPRPGYCSLFLKEAGRHCKNKATAGGKCKTHGG